MTDDDLAEIDVNYHARYGDRIRTHNPDCWKWADHAECTVARLVAEVRRLSAEADLYRRGYDLIGACDISNYLARCAEAGKVLKG
jgi:hypothetical protein